MDIYSVLAKYYDEFTDKDCDYTSWSQYLYDVAKLYNCNEIVDIACGTGKMTELLCKRGFALTGADASVDMLNVARTKCRANFVRQDMRRLQLAHPVSMAVCVNDGVNYLKPAELAPFFERVAANITSGAPFVFDVSSPYKLRETLGNNVFYRDYEQETLLWCNTLRDDSVQMELTLFVKDGEIYRRFDERHVQYIHTRLQIEQALTAARFQIREVSDSYGHALAPHSPRITFYAVKR